MAGEPADDGFDEFVEARYGDLVRVAYLLTGSAHDAEDLVQGALVSTLRKWSKVDDPMAYVRRAMVNQHVNSWRRFGRREYVSARPPEPDRVPDIADGVAQRLALQAALRTLAPRARVVVTLRYLADLSEAEVAAALGTSVGNVKGLASRGLAKLRAAMKAAPTREPEEITL
ncbi:SigE family RNA polymerase sigma factor [Hamadaea tsunoensis]|uniref:SigE family RNA polymerase sigma factor n=1 Tax=Hamadaea tsunoensis TaxID=53368 RepID=UPI0004122DAD|nr:SigE family RNA polymerase sigma factor [Hamadaea tsunoensis]